MDMEIQKGMVTPCKSEKELLQHFGCYGFEKQLNFYEIIGDSDWQIDINQGVIYFGDNITFSIQLLGTFSLSSETWLWSWNNEASQLPTSVIEQALSLKSYGEENDINLFTSAQFDTTQEDLYKIGVIATGMFDTNGYYLANFGEGIALVTIKKDHINSKNNNQNKISKILPKFITNLFGRSSSENNNDEHKNNQTQIFETFSQFISNFDVDHYQALKYYLIAKDYQIEKSNLTDQIELVAIKNEQKIVAKFDKQSRLISLNA
ncbi:hypothetical protein GQ597_05570 [Gilliamella sp. Pra-s65]|uniref:DUF6882 domain-containing protein n=1 Tax=unclassified Gilliamella TaxID=2685620 RepID=UPI001365C446|nr:MULTISPECIES: DUF6882 domain-containing protein [unclassified Gilliamella]MWN90168.1 hypothetical protein [Gilliamella sp. Pra-s65]MWP47861.1 hypothetical protein [Gilliamella sp. Pas-s27]MWP73149.1 hypothetical protein [Gilliamella sp. Pra-s52]